MPKASKESASEHETVEGYEGHFEHFDGGWTVAFEAYSQDADLAPFFKGLPNDECQCEHMGYVIRGKVGFRSGGNEELFEAGDAYYVGPGHTPILYAGTEVVEFSPSEEHRPDHGGRDEEHGGDGGVRLIRREPVSGARGSGSRTGSPRPTPSAGSRARALLPRPSASARGAAGSTS